MPDEQIDNQQNTRLNSSPNNQNKLSYFHNSVWQLTPELGFAKSLITGIVFIMIMAALIYTGLPPKLGGVIIIAVVFMTIWKYIIYRYKQAQLIKNKSKNDNSSQI